MVLLNEIIYSIEFCGHYKCPGTPTKRQQRKMGRDGDGGGADFEYSTH